MKLWVENICMKLWYSVCHYIMCAVASKPMHDIMKQLAVVHHHNYQVDHLLQHITLFLPSCSNTSYHISEKLSWGNLANRWWFVKLKPSTLVLTINNLLADVLFCQMLKKSQFPNLYPHQMSHYTVLYLHSYFPVRYNPKRTFL